MQSVIDKINQKHTKSAVVDVRSGDTVRVHQKIQEGNKERVQVFEGLVIRTDRKNSHTARITVRRIANGVGVEKSYLVHSPLVLKVEVVKRSKVRRKYLSYMRELTGKSARLTGVDFDKEGVNVIIDEKAAKEENKMHEDAEKQHEAEAAKDAEKEQEAEAKVEAAKEAHKDAEKDSDSDKDSKKSEAKEEKSEK